MTRSARRFLSVARGVPVLVLTAFGLAAAFVGVVTASLAGSALGDPGGWRGVAIAVGLVGVVVGVATVALVDPDSGAALVGLLSLGPIGLGAWSYVDHGAVRVWEDRTGPVGLALVVVVAAGAAVLGLQRPGVGGTFLVLVTVVPAVLAVAGAGAGWAAEVILALIPSPLLVAGGLLLAAAYGARHGERSARTRRSPAPRVPPAIGPHPA
jgi:MFS family permease